MQVMRRVAAILFVATLVSLPSASSALATTDPAPLPNLSSPAVTRVSSGDTYVFARGTDGSLIVNRRINNAFWTGSTSLGGGIIGSPSVVAVGNSAWAFVRGLDDNVFMVRVTDGRSSGYQHVPGLKTSGRVTAVSGLDGDTGRVIVSVFARGLDGTGWTNRFRDGAWSGWRNLGAVPLTSDITAVAGGGNTSIYARGADNGGLFATSSDGENYSPWSSLGGGLTSNIAAIKPPNGGSNTLLFARGFDNGLYVNVLDRNGFSGWRGVGGGITSDPFAVASGDGRVVVMARGNDLGLYANTFDINGGSSGYVGLGGGFLGNPVAIPLPPQPGRTGIEVFARGFDNGLYTIRQVNGGFSGFVGLGGQLG